MLVTVDVEQIDRRITEIKLEIEKLEGKIKNLSFENNGLESLKAEIERFSVKDDNPTLQEEIFHLLSIHKKLTTLQRKIKSSFPVNCVKIDLHLLIYIPFLTQ